jgi:tetratricopeptide (TPR) repeat protein
VFDAAAHPMAHRAHRGEATALARMGRVEDAVIAQRRAVEQLVATRGTDHRDTVDAEVNLAEFLLESGDTDEARAVLRRIREAGVSSSTEPHLVRVEGLLALALGQRSRAVELFERALQSGELPPLAEAWTRYGLARALYPHDRARAIAEATAARDALRPFPHQHTEVVTWLAKHG